MKKQLFLMMLVFTLGSMQPIYAQGWLKALGEIAKGVLESDDASDNTAKSTSNSSSSGDKALYKGGLGSSFTVDGINIKFTECEQYVIKSTPILCLQTQGLQKINSLDGVIILSMSTIRI